jgi:phosphonate transport system permease protein
MSGARNTGLGRDRQQRIAELAARRPRSRYLIVSVGLVGLLGVLAWTTGGLFPSYLLEASSRQNLARFVGELEPEPLRGRSWSFGELVDWAGNVLERTRGLEAAWTTLHLALLAIALSALFAALVAPLGARNLATREPLDPSQDRGGWRVLRQFVRGSFVASRALPEYVLAFLFMALLPFSAWPAVLALAIHNGGILARLQAETLENLPAAPLRALRGAGATRAQVAFAAGFPLSLGRQLLYVFYRYETCVREATVLGLLGVSTLGYVIQDARSKLYYDEMALLIGLGVVLVLAADALSYVVRRFVRDA